MNLTSALAALTVLACFTPLASAQWHPKDTEWWSYNADLTGSRYRPLDQINASNFSKLEVAWRFKTNNIGNRPEYKLEGTPLMVNGVVYATAGSRRAAIALDAATGELLWVHGEHEGERGASSPRQLCPDAVLRTGQTAEKSVSSMSPAATDWSRWTPKPDAHPLIRQERHRRSEARRRPKHLRLERERRMGTRSSHGEIGLQSAPVVAKDTILIGAAFREGMTPKSMRNNKGYVRGFDVRTGKRLWIFHTIPMKGEFGYDTWGNDSAEYTGNTGVWTQITVDEQLGLAYLPVESPTGDLLWRAPAGQQSVRRDPGLRGSQDRQAQVAFSDGASPLWDMDISSAPMLVDINVDGKASRRSRSPSKQGFLYVFDRVTGKPVWPIEERPCEGRCSRASGIRRRSLSHQAARLRTQRRHARRSDRLHARTSRQALTQVSQYKMGPVFTPPSSAKRAARSAH